MSLEYYRSRFAKLRVDTKPFWPSATFHRAPYKPILLLSIIDLIAQGIVTENRIRFDVNLLETFERYWVHIIGTLRESNPLMPFYHLQSEGFWHLTMTDGRVIDLRHMDRNEVFRRIKNQILIACVDDSLFTLLTASESRNILQSLLADSYFTAEAREAVAQVSQITAESYSYSRTILHRSRSQFILQDPPALGERYIAEVRSTGFRRVIVDAYYHTCAICRLRIVTPEGRSMVEAAHIVPWSHSHNDDPRNGLALCGLHHWTFDQGLIGISPEYTIKLSPVLTQENQDAQPLLVLDGAGIHRPMERTLWPARSALRWHMDNVFRAEQP